VTSLLARTLRGATGEKEREAWKAMENQAATRPGTTWHGEAAVGQDRGNSLNGTGSSKRGKNHAVSAGCCGGLSTRVDGLRDGTGEGGAGEQVDSASLETPCLNSCINTIPFQAIGKGAERRNQRSGQGVQRVQPSGAGLGGASPSHKIEEGGSGRRKGAAESNAARQLSCLACTSGAKPKRGVQREQDPSGREKRGRSFRPALCGSVLAV